jgi:hypothetical protein
MYENLRPNCSKLLVTDRNKHFSLLLFRGKAYSYKRFMVLNPWGEIPKTFFKELAKKLQQKPENCISITKSLPFVFL